MSLGTALPPPIPLSSMAMSSLPDGFPMVSPGQRVSPLMIADHLITLAEHADRAGFQITASNLVKLVFTVLDEHGAPN